VSQRVESAVMKRKLDVGGTLSQIFSTYGDQAGVLLPVAFGLFLLVAVVNGIVAGSLILLPVGLAVSVVAATLYQGMVVGLVRDVQDGRRDSSVGELIEATWPVVLPLIGAGILAGLGIGVGFLLFIVPGLILLTIWSMIAPVIVVERSGAIDAFGRSRALVKDNGWQVFGVIFVVFLITAIVSGVLGAIGAGISDSFGMRVLVNVIASTLTAPIAALAASTIYFSLLASNDSAPSPTAPPTPPSDQPAV
jgi:ABC-type multidrug transport system fused ATPase/permease subunit